MTNLITHRAPESWQALEDAVQGILSECGMTAERQAHLSFPRGGATVDVFATEVVAGISSSTICECKYWRTRVSQDVVQSFRTVMQESGANRGYIISKVGFQSGAIQAAHATNIELLTFEGFQDRYFEKWVSRRLWAVEKAVGSIGTYYEPFGIPGMNQIADEVDQARYYEVWRKYMFVGVILPSFSPYMRTLGRPCPLPTLPIDIDGAITNYEVVVPKDLAAATGYREFLELLEAYALEGLQALRALNPIISGKANGKIARDD